MIRFIALIALLGVALAGCFGAYGNGSFNDGLFIGWCIAAVIWGLWGYSEIKNETI